MIRACWFSIVEKLGDFLGAPLRGAPVEDLALGDQVMHRPHGFAYGRVRVCPVAEIRRLIVALVAVIPTTGLRSR